MTDNQAVEYLTLVDRKLQILLNSGINWKPEYGSEMKKIDARLAELRPLIDAEYERREKKNEAAEKADAGAEETDCCRRAGSGKVVGNA